MESSALMSTVFHKGELNIWRMDGDKIFLGYILKDFIYERETPEKYIADK